MAEVTQIDTGTPQIPPPIPAAPPKRGPGRPRKVKPPEPADDDDDNLPQAASVDRDIWLDLANYKPADWDRTIAYLYRVAPTIDRRSGGRPINIRKYAGPFDKDRIMLDEGSGVYRIDILRIDQETGQYRRLTKEYFDILNMDYPPRVPPGDWLEDPANEVWKWAGPKLEAAKQAANGGGMYPPGFDIDKMTDKIMDRAERMATANNANKGPSDTLLEKILDKVMTPAPPPDNSSLNFIIQELRADRKELREELRELRNKPAPQPAKGILEQLEEGMPIIDKIVAKFSTRTSKSDIWQNITEKAVDQIPDLIQLGHDLLKKPAPQPQQQRQQSQGLPPAQAQPPTPTAEMTPDQQTQQRLQWILQKHQEHLFSIAPTIIEYFKVGDGFGLRDWYLPLHGLLNWADLRRDITPELLTNILSAHAFLKTELAPPERLTTFFEEFFTDQDADESEDAPPHVEHANGVSAVLQPEAKAKRMPKGAH